MEKFEQYGNDNKYFTGTVFATFKDVLDYDTYKSHFPNSTLGRMWTYFKVYAISCFFDKKKQKYNRKSLELTVDWAPEPSDIKWENLQFTNYERNIRNLNMTVVVFLILCVSFGALFGISKIQENLNYDNKIAKNIFAVIFALITSLFNWLIQKTMLRLTIYEKNISQTKYLLSFSVKLLLTTFINSGPLVVVVNYLSGNWENKQVLVNNVFYIFIINSISNPIYYLVNPFYWLNVFKRNALDGEREKDENFTLDKTQGELNE